MEAISAARPAHENGEEKTEGSFENPFEVNDETLGKALTD